MSSRGTGTRSEAPSYVFIVGTGRCGSSLVHEVLAGHPDVGFISNLDDLLPWPRLNGRWNNGLYHRLPPHFTRKGRVRFAPSEGYRLLEREVSPIVVRPPRDLLAEDAAPWLAERLRRAFETRARVQGRPVFLHKFTGWPRTGLIRAVFPEARFVHVVRDGRAVANSLVQMAWWQGFRGPDHWDWGPLTESDRRAWEATGRSFAVLAGLEWKLLMEAFEAAKAQVRPDHWLDVRYEDLLAEPREETARILRFMQLDRSSGFERRFARHRFSDLRADAFRKELTSADLDALERALGPWLERLGYLAPGPEGANPGAVIR
jgi:hypothetical protein